MKVDLCRVCGEPSMVMSAGNTKKVPYRMSAEAVSFICALCVVQGALRKERK